LPGPWFRKAHQHLKPGQRAGLVGTNSISQNRARSVSLGFIVENGGTITDAISSQKWPGEAKVHVSLVNWVKGETGGPFTVDGLVVEGLDSSLHVNVRGAWSPRQLSANRGRCFQGVTPVGAGFIVGVEEAAALHARSDVEYREVVRRYVTSEDLAGDVAQSGSRWIIDLGQRTLEEAQRFPTALEIVRRRVRPDRQSNRDRFRREHWWSFGRPYGEVRSAIQDVGRYVSGIRVGKRLLLAFSAPDVTPSDATNVFALEDDFSMGILQSRAHSAWAWQQSSTMKGDLRYTPTSVFMTFPWAGAFASSEQRDRVADACRRLLARRSEICQAEQVGLTTLYNQVDDGAWTDLKALHRELDVAVADCYGWPRSIAQDDAEIVRRLTALNREIVEGSTAYEPFAYLERQTQS